jgi:hypothetical protein
MKSKKSSYNNRKVKKAIINDHNHDSRRTTGRSKGRGKGIKARRTLRMARGKTSKRLLNRQNQDISITRSSGRKEKFNTDRMTQTVSRSGVPFMMARDIAKTVTKKIKKESGRGQQRHVVKTKNQKQERIAGRRKKTVTASRVRSLIAEELHDRNRADIAASYSGKIPENTLKQEYENLKDKQPVDDTVAANRNRVLYDSSKRGGGGIAT